MIRPALRTLLISILSLSLLSACGFHLRGSQQNTFAIEQFTIVGDNRFDGVASEIQRIALSHDIEINTTAAWQIRLSDETVDRWTVSSNQGYSNNEYWLSVSVMVYFSHNGTELLPIPFKREAIFQDNTDQLNSKTGERNLITQELRVQLAESILHQLSYLIANPPDCNCDEN